MPFDNVSDPAFFYYSEEHKEVLARMSYAVQQKKVGVLILGECGTGKTFVSRVLKEMCNKNKCSFIYLVNPRLSPLEFLKDIYYQLTGSTESVAALAKPDLLRLIQKSLESQQHKGIYPVLIVDEAQSIQTDELLEEMRLFLNIQSDTEVLFTLIMLGQPNLEEKIDAIPQFRQRFAIRYKLYPLNNDATKEYIEYRLKVAGTVLRLFSDDAYAQIYKVSGGIPRVINNICDLALLSGFLKGVKIVDREIIDHAAADLCANIDQSQDN